MEFQTFCILLIFYKFTFRRIINAMHQRRTASWRAMVPHHNGHQDLAPQNRRRIAVGLAVRTDTYLDFYETARVPCIETARTP